jgi:hypothetical protein
MRMAFAFALTLSLALGSLILPAQGVRGDIYDIVVTADTERAWHGPGELVNMSTTIQNLGEESFSWEYTCLPQTHYYIVSLHGWQIVYDSSKHRQVMLPVGTTTLAPGEKYTEHCTQDPAEYPCFFPAWNQTDDDGNPVPTPGLYIVVGCADFIGIESDWSNLLKLGGPNVVSGVSSDKSIYRPDEVVEVVVNVTNLGDDDVTLSFPNSLQAHYTVETLGGTQVYNLRWHVYILPWATELTLAPQETYGYTFADTHAWNQTFDDGTNVTRPGYYRIAGVVNHDSCLPAPSTCIALSNESSIAPSLTVESSTTDLRVRADGSLSTSLDGTSDFVEYRWDWEGDGAWDTEWLPIKRMNHTYAVQGVYTVRMEVRDPVGLTAVTEEIVLVGTDIPEFPSGLLPLTVVLAVTLLAIRSRSRVRGRPREPRDL